MPVTIGGNPVTPLQAEQLRAAFGIPEPVVVSESLTALAAGDTFLVRDASDNNTLKLATAALVADFAGAAPPADTVPDAFSAGQWTLTPIAGGVRIGITELPYNGGPAISAIQRTFDAGTTWTSLAAATTGDYDVTGLPETLQSVQLRAVNSVGNGAASDVKTATPAASGGGGAVTFVAAGTPYSTISLLTEHTVSVPAGMQVGDLLAVTIGDYAAASSVVTSTGQNLAQAVRQVGAVWWVVLTGTVPTSVTVNFAAESDLAANTIAYRGPTSVAGIVNDEAFEARPTIPYTTTAANAAVVLVYVRNHPNNATAAQFNGADAADYLHKIEFSSIGIVTGIHDGPTGSNVIDMAWNLEDTGGRYISVAFGT